MLAGQILPTMEQHSSSSSSSSCDESKEGALFSFAPFTEHLPTVSISACSVGCIKDHCEEYCACIGTKNGDKKCCGGRSKRVAEEPESNGEESEDDEEDGEGGVLVHYPRSEKKESATEPFPDFGM